MNFSDPSERDKVFGPLYATAAKAQIPIFGPEKFTSKNAQQLLDSTLKQDLQSEENPVVNLLPTKKLKMGQRPSDISQFGGSLSEDLEKLKVESQGLKDTESTTSKKLSSHRELHDQAHYTVRLDATSTESKEELLNHAMLQRAIDGYLFDCKMNKAIVKDDLWLRDVWEWIEGR